MAGPFESEGGRIRPGTLYLHPLRLVAKAIQNLSLGLFRSDYMVHQSDVQITPTIKQVEFNTIASSFGGLSAQTSKLHK